MCYTVREQLACDANSSPALPPFWGERDSAVKADIFSGWDLNLNPLNHVGWETISLSITARCMPVRKCLFILLMLKNQE